MWSVVDFSTLKGKTLSSVVKDPNDEYIDFYTVEDIHYRMYHQQNCSETVDLHRKEP